MQTVYCVFLCLLSVCKLWAWLIYMLALRLLLRIPKVQWLPRQRAPHRIPQQHPVHLHRREAYAAEQSVNEYFRRYPRSRMSA